MLILLYLGIKGGFLMKFVKFFKKLLKDSHQTSHPNTVLDINKKKETMSTVRTEASKTGIPFGNATQEEEKYQSNSNFFKEWLCPYCNHKFDKELTRKRKCPKCQNTFLIRTHFKTKQKLVLTEVQLELFEKEKEKYYEQKWIEDFFIKHGTTLEKEEKNSSSSYPYDIAWGLLNRISMENASTMSWGLFRNCRMDMAELLKKEGKTKKSLLFYLEVCYYDINGATNTTTNPELLKEYPPFRPKDFGFLAPGIMDYVESLTNELNLNIEEIQAMFIAHNNHSYKNNNLIPLSPEKAWNTFEKELTKRKK